MMINDGVDEASVQHPHKCATVPRIPTVNGTYSVYVPENIEYTACWRSGCPAPRAACSSEIACGSVCDECLVGSYDETLYFVHEKTDHPFCTFT